MKYLSGTSGTGGTVIGTYRTMKNGSFTVTGLQAGAYIVEELASDSGHIVDAAPQTAYISGKQQDVVQLYFGNSPKSSLLISKVDARDGPRSVMWNFWSPPAMAPFWATPTGST